MLQAADIDGVEIVPRQSIAIRAFGPNFESDDL